MTTPVIKSYSEALLGFHSLVIISIISKTFSDLARKVQLLRNFQFFENFSFNIFNLRSVFLIGEVDSWDLLNLLVAFYSDYSLTCVRDNFSRYRLFSSSICIFKILEGLFKFALSLRPCFRPTFPQFFSLESPFEISFAISLSYLQMEVCSNRLHRSSLLDSLTHSTFLLCGTFQSSFSSAG